MQLIVNGDIHQIAGPLSLAELVKQFGLEPRKVAIERNLEIVPRSTYADIVLGEGDRLEIVHFVGGG